jgi:hypothetical protein
VKEGKKFALEANQTKILLLSIKMSLTPQQEKYKKKLSKLIDVAVQTRKDSITIYDKNLPPPDGDGGVEDIFSVLEAHYYNNQHLGVHIWKRGINEIQVDITYLSNVYPPEWSLVDNDSISKAMLERCKRVIDALELPLRDTQSHMIPIKFRGSEEEVKRLWEVSKVLRDRTNRWQIYKMIKGWALVQINGRRENG